LHFLITSVDDYESWPKCLRLSVLVLVQQQAQQQKTFLLRQPLRQSLQQVQVPNVPQEQEHLQRLCQQVR
jgi:hypothetical protein